MASSRTPVRLVHQTGHTWNGDCSIVCMWPEDARSLSDRSPAFFKKLNVEHRMQVALYSLGIKPSSETKQD